MIHRTKIKWTLYVTLMLVASYSGVAFANVSIKNGNFFIGYTDIIYPGGFEPKIERVYNSKTSFKGIFGWGWGNEYEAFLSVAADGSVVAHEYGGGAENRFAPSKPNAKEVTQAVEKIAQVAQSVGVAGSKAQFEAYKARLLSDAGFRNDEWEKFRTQGKLQARQLPVGTQLRSNHFSYQVISKVADGYLRTYEGGKVEKFDELGRLSKISDANGNSMTFTYGSDKHLQKIVDNFNRKMFFEFDNRGLLSKIEGENGKKAEFKYNSDDELVYSKDVDGNTYTYAYDKEKRHNLTEIGYSDKTSMKIAYYGRDKREDVQSIKDRGGSSTEYVYDTSSIASGKFSVSVTVKGADGKVISTGKYEYVTKKRGDGEEWTQKLTTTLDGDKTETTYNEACALPVSIRYNGEETTFAYDGKCRVLKKTTPTDVTTIAYDDRAGKVKKVSRTSKTNKKDTITSEFEYDEKNNLKFARNSDKKTVKLLYDTNGRIRAMLDQNKHQITFKYNENSKPIEITDPSIGTISVSYTNSGEIKKVDSTAGRKIALQVTSTFQNLLDIIRPAGVTLAF